MVKSLILSLILSTGAVGWGAPNCRTALITTEAPKVRFNDSINTWYATVDMGYHDKILGGSPWAEKREIKMLIPEKKNQRAFPLSQTWLMPGARSDSASYFAKISAGPKPEDHRTELYSIQGSKKLNEMLDRHLALVWETYLQEGTVQRQDIESFVATEAQLDVQRKITFVTSDPKTGQTLAVMRAYDGTNFPSMYFSDMATHLEAPKTDPRVPVERRYPQINFRTQTDYIIEPGRLAKTRGLENGALEFHFFSLSEYLLRKYGFLRVAPRDFLKGHILIEITGRNLKKFMSSRKQDGYGFQLDYFVPQGGAPQKVSSGTAFEKLPVKAQDLGTKFILHCEIFQFINAFHSEMSLAPIDQVHPHLSENQ